MHGEFDEELEPVRRRADTELTLSSTTLLGIFFGMVLLCALFFGLGFAVGRFGPGDSAGAGQQAGSGGPSPALAASSKPKPSAAPQDTVQAERSAASLRHTRLLTRIPAQMRNRRPPPAVNRR